LKISQDKIEEIRERVSVMARLMNSNFNAFGETTYSGFLPGDTAVILNEPVIAPIVFNNGVKLISGLDYKVGPKGETLEMVSPLSVGDNINVVDLGRAVLTLMGLVEEGDE